MHGWTGKILQIDLTRRTWSVWRPEESFYYRYIGGKGICGQILHPHITREWDDSEMPLIFATGPLVDTPAPTSGRSTVASRSPLTGTVGDTSVGGRIGVQTKRAGWDAIVVTGRSGSWCGVVVKDETVEFQDATELFGLPIGKRLEKLKDKGAIALIGPASENGVLFANIMIDGHYAAGRNGLGLIMASKRLGFVKISGSSRPQIFDRKELLKAREEIQRLATASPILKGDLGISHYGTAALFDLTHSRRMMPTDNFRSTYFEGAESFNAHQYRKRFGYKKVGCAGCHILCKKKGTNGESLPEFETMSHFHALLNNRDMDAVVKANAICNEMGMDTVSAGATLACFAEIAGRTLAPGEITALLEDIGLSRGEGERLKLGSYRYADSMGKVGASMSVKKMELPAYDPRGVYGMAIGYAMSTRGGCHLRAYPISHEILRKPVATDRFTFSGKARIIKIAEDANAVIDSLTACKFIFFGASLEEYARAVYGATGMKTSGQDLLKIGERIYYNDRILNAMNGFSAKDDDLPERFFKEPGSHGDGISVKPIDRDAFLKARADYYAIRGLDANGMPTTEKCEELGLDSNFGTGG